MDVVWARVPPPRRFEEMDAYEGPVMRKLSALGVSLCLMLLGATMPVAAGSDLVDCAAGDDLKAAINAANPGDTLKIKGTCDVSYFRNISWSDQDRVERLITEEIPARVAADHAYQNARQNSDKANARIEHDKALRRVMTALLKDDTELFKQFSDNPSFKRWLSDTVFTYTYDQ